MTTASTPHTTLHSTMLEIVAKYNAAGNHLAQALNAGTQRVLDRASGNAVALPGAAAASESLGRARDSFQKFVRDSVERDTTRAMQFMNGMAERVSNGIDRTAESLQRLNTGASAPIFSAAASLHLPGAQLSLKVAEAVETDREVTL